MFVGISLQFMSFEVWSLCWISKVCEWNADPKHISHSLELLYVIFAKLFFTVFYKFVQEPIMTVQVFQIAACVYLYPVSLEWVRKSHCYLSHLIFVFIVVLLK